MNRFPLSLLCDFCFRGLGMAIVCLPTESTSRHTDSEAIASDFQRIGKDFSTVMTRENVAAIVAEAEKIAPQQLEFNSLK